MIKKGRRHANNTALKPELESLANRDAIIVIEIKGTRNMIEKELVKRISTKLIVDKENFMRSFRWNLGKFIETPEITIKQLSEESGISYATLNSVLYGNSSDVKLSTAISLSKALGISIDELVGAGTMEDKMMESVKICRALPEHSLYLVRYLIRHQGKIYSELGYKQKYISVVKPQLINGIIATTNAVEPMCVDNLPEDVKSKAYIGIQIPCDYYMPFYLPGEILLLAADREEQGGERCVVTSNGGIYIVVKIHVFENGKIVWKYVPLMSPESILPDGIIDEKIGYVVGFLDVNGVWGIR